MAGAPLHAPARETVAPEPPPLLTIKTGAIRRTSSVPAAALGPPRSLSGLARAAAAAAAAATRAPQPPTAAARRDGKETERRAATTIHTLWLTFSDAEMVRVRATARGGVRSLESPHTSHNNKKFRSPPKRLND